MSRIKISYSLTRRPSQSRMAAIYMDIIGADHDLIGAQDTADVVIVHHPPRNYETVYALHPALRDRYVISCCVPHSEDVPGLWQRNLQRVQEVWTPSEFCRRALAPHHPNVVTVPYVVERDMTISDEARIGVERMIAFDPDLVYFLALGPLDEPRKNIPTLVETFISVSDSMPNARLIIKSTISDAPCWAPHPQLIFLPLQMPFDYVSALYELSTVYVSAHHAEGWGLGISDAMLFGKPVIATGYSGNLEYMTAENSFLVRWKEGNVVDIRDPGIAVEPGMRWADPDRDHLAELLLQLYHTHDQASVQNRVRRASEDLRHFGRDAAARAIRRRIGEIMQ